MALDPKKINNFVLFDFETSGLDKEENLHAKKYAVMEFAATALNGVTLEEILTYDNLLKPYDDELIYDPGATAIHGLTKEQCELEGVPLKELVNDMITFFQEAHNGSKYQKPILVGHNVDFDAPFLEDLFVRAGKDLSKYVDGYFDAYGVFHCHTLDTIDEAKQVWAEVADAATTFRLGACCQRAGLDLADAHRAKQDVLALAELFRYFVLRKRRGGSTTQSVENVDLTAHRRGFQW
jgi:DNA polymerase III epsilon subunit-like protein